MIVISTIPVAQPYARLVLQPMKIVVHRGEMDRILLISKFPTVGTSASNIVCSDAKTRAEMHESNVEPAVPWQQIANYDPLLDMVLDSETDRRKCQSDGIFESHCRCKSRVFPREVQHEQWAMSHGMTPMCHLLAKICCTRSDGDNHIELRLCVANIEYQILFSARATVAA